MPRGQRAQMRQPTAEDLTGEQLAFYEQLPSDDLKKMYLSQLPPVSTSTEQSKKKAQAIRSSIAMMKRVVDALNTQIESMDETAASLEKGRNAASVDLRKITAPPKIPGVILRFTRSK